MNQSKGRDLTPFIDSLCGVSLWYSGISNSKRSIEALPAILSGLPNLMIHDYITSPYAGNEINSVASLLKQQGYNTSFYHGGNNGTMGFDAYCQMAGFEHYYGRNEYPDQNDFDGKWGIWDHAFFSWFASSLNKTPQPFLSGIFSLSSHHPYSIPPGMEKQFPQGETKIMATIAYTDYALRLFFDKAKTMPWFENTIFVITADHTSETKDPWYQTRAGMYSIPVIFYKHNEKLHADSERVVQQTDILPTVLDYLQYPSPFLAFGNSVFDTTSRAFAVNFVNPEYTIFMQNHMLILAGDSASYVYDIQRDSFQKQNILNPKNEFQLQMLQCGKSLIQQYNQRMVSNNLTIRRK
jgi:phosphoglycerol transferase MdoB-like AlkP superfamily enzyme